MQPRDLIYLVHGTNVHEWWLKLLSGPGQWWIPTSPFAEAIGRSFGAPCEMRTHVWSGKNRHQDRIDAAKGLASELSKHDPQRKVHLVGHSHGGNIALLAANLLDKGRTENIVLLANPNMALLYPEERECDAGFEVGDNALPGCNESATSCHWLYWGEAIQKVNTTIWNLYSPQDAIQSSAARLVHGVKVPQSPRLGGASLSVLRTRRSPSGKLRNERVLWRKHGIANLLTYPAGRGLSGHSAMHSTPMGTVVGKLLLGQHFDAAMSAADLQVKEANEIRNAGG